MARRSSRAILCWWGVGGLALLAAASSLGCRGQGAGDTTPPADRPIVLAASGDTAGWIVPCGCASNQSGGLLRRGTYLAALRANADVVLLDAGGAVGGASEYDRAKLVAILRGEVKMGIAAHNIGGPELALGVDFLRQAATDTGAPFVSANLLTPQGDRVFDPLRVIEVGGLRIVVVGVLSQKYAGQDSRVDPPLEAVLRAFDSVPAPRADDRRVVLAYLDEQELNELAAALPEADLVLGGPTGQAVPPKLVGTTTLASATNKGKFLVQLNVPAGPTRPWPGSVVEMSQDLADEAGQDANLKAFLAELERLDLSAQATNFAPQLPAEVPEGYRIANSAACADCHQEEYQAWESSAHAHAWQTLVGRGFHVDSYCQHCHTTGYGFPDGFVSARTSPELVSVGCESCHGPSLSHTQDPSVRTAFNARDRCIACHDHENSPQFDYTTYWPKIDHGTKDSGEDESAAGGQPTGEPQGTAP